MQILKKHSASCRSCPRKCAHGPVDGEPNNNMPSPNPPPSNIEDTLEVLPDVPNLNPPMPNVNEDILEAPPGNFLSSLSVHTF